MNTNFPRGGLASMPPSREQNSYEGMGAKERAARQSSDRAQAAYNRQSNPPPQLGSAQHRAMMPRNWGQQAPATPPAHIYGNGGTTRSNPSRGQWEDWVKQQRGGGLFGGMGGGGQMPSPPNYQQAARQQAMQSRQNTLGGGLFGGMGGGMQPAPMQSRKGGGQDRAAMSQMAQQQQQGRRPGMQGNMQQAMGGMRQSTGGMDGIGRMLQGAQQPRRAPGNMQQGMPSAPMQNRKGG